MGHNTLNKGALQRLIQYRQELHQHPEISGEEKLTSRRVAKWIERYEPDEIISGLGGHGLAAIFRGRHQGQTVLFRAELDALPLKETNSFGHRSKNPQTAHLCGHDGHMAFLLGMAENLHSDPPERGTAVLLFQPAEETGTGAEKVLKDPGFSSIQPDYVFAIHNLPGFDLHQVIFSNKHFAAASTGMIIRLQGRTSHAAEPEKGLSPAMAVAKIIQRLHELPSKLQNLQGFALLTVIHVKIGEVAFGTTPGEAVVMATLRAFEDDDLKNLSLEAENLIAFISQREGLDYEITYTESFPATINDAYAADFINKAAGKLNLDIHMIEEPFKWTEDFGHFTSQHQGALIGLGSGIKQPALHNPDYDFPDDLIPTGVGLFRQIFDDINSKY
jgi:amidohydrolase